MWKKTEDPRPGAADTQSAAPAPKRKDSRSVATIGPSILVKGDLSGEEDLLVQGRVEGKISLRQNNVTIGQNGRIKADVHGKSIRVEGEVKGNLYGDREIVICASGRVQGNLISPRVTLENGSKFKGSIDMEAASLKPSEPQGPQADKAKKPPAQAGEKPLQRPQSTVNPRPAQT